MLMLGGNEDILVEAAKRGRKAYIGNPMFGAWHGSFYAPLHSAGGPRINQNRFIMQHANTQDLFQSYELAEPAPFFTYGLNSALALTIKPPLPPPSDISDYYQHFQLTTFHLVLLLVT